MGVRLGGNGRDWKRILAGEWKCYGMYPRERGAVCRLAWLCKSSWHVSFTPWPLRRALWALGEHPPTGQMPATGRRRN